MPTRIFNKKTFSSLKIRNFRLYFIGQAISLCGTWMQTIGQSWLVLKLTGSGTALGLVTALQFVPILVLGPFGGVIADRFPKRRTLYFTQTAAGLLALILGLLVTFGSIKLWEIYLLAIGLGLVNVIDNPTRQTFLMEMAGKEQFTNAVSLNSTQVNLARVLGPAIAGVLIATAGMAVCFFINAASYIAVLVALFMMRDKELVKSALAERVKGQLAAGFKYVKSSPVLKNTLLMMAIVGTLSYEFTVILPLVAQFSLHGGAGTYAALTSAMGLGSIFGGLYTATRRKTSPSMLVSAAFLFGAVILIASLMPGLVLLLLAMVLVGFFSINFLSLGNIILQLESEPQMRGRVMSLWTVAFLGSTPIGGPIIGAIGEYAGPRWGLAIGGVAALAAGAFGARNLRKLKTPEPEPTEEISDEAATEEEAKITSKS